MGARQSSQSNLLPSPDHTATLYYFAGRGLADQVRWMLAASDISFTQKVISSREKFLQMAEMQLPFGQLPLLQIDGLELVQSQAIVRYIAKRGNLIGSSAEEELKADMIAESVRDLLSLAVSAPFKRKSQIEIDSHVALMKKKWEFLSVRYEAGLRMAANKEYMVGNSLTYADILVAHVTTWFIEECGPEIVENLPYLVALQVKVISLPGINAFIKSRLYCPLGDEAYVKQVQTVLDKVV